LEKKGTKKAMQGNMEKGKTATNHRTEGRLGGEGFEERKNVIQKTKGLWSTTAKGCKRGKKTTLGKKRFSKEKNPGWRRTFAEKESRETWRNLGGGGENLIK